MSINGFRFLRTDGLDSFFMKAFSKLKDYFNAVRSTQNVGGKSFFGAAFSVVRARAQFGVGPKVYSLHSLYNEKPENWPLYDIAVPLEVALRRANPPSSRGLIKDKFLFYKHCSEFDIPVVPTFDLDGFFGEITTGAVEDILKKGRLFLKPVDSAHGHGALVAKRDQEGSWAFNDQVGTLGDLYAFCQSNKTYRNWIVQPVLETHPDLIPPCSPSCLSTVRVVTIRSESIVKVLYAVLKVGSGETQIDNFSLGSTGNGLAAVDIESGKLGCLRLSVSKTWPSIKSYEVDPGSGVRMSDITVPHWQEVKHLLIKAHNTFSDFKSLGWDVAITDNGVYILEANTNYGGEIHQVSMGRGLKRELLDILKSP